jgi:uncharacterized protein (DUF885 family)
MMQRLLKTGKVGITLLLLLVLAPALRAEKPALRPEFQSVLDLLGAKNRAGPEKLSAARESLERVPRTALPDDDWIDLHILLFELDRRRFPRPTPRKAPIRSRFLAGRIPTALSAKETADPLALIDLAAELHSLCPEAGPGEPAAEDLREWAVAAKRAGGLAASLETATPSADPLTRSSRAALCETTRDLEFDLECLAAGLRPAGRAVFAWQLQRRHRIAMTPEETLEIGRRAIEDTVSKLEREARDIAPHRTWQSLVREYQEDRPENQAALLEACRKITVRAEQAVRESGLISVPEFARAPRVLLEKPKFPAPFACYYPGGKPHEGRYGGRVICSALPNGLTPEAREARLRDRSYSWLRVIYPHEAIPGHHLQFAVADRHRRPARGYGYNSSYVEGWGLYSEELMRRIGFLDDPASRLAFLRMRLWRAMRVVIDYGLHVGGMRPSAAVNLLESEVLMERSAAMEEVRRYLSSPTQPLSYLLGYRRICAIRDGFVARNGATSLREFHDRFLSLGAIPLDLAAAVLLDKRAAYDARRASLTPSR